MIDWINLLFNTFWIIGFAIILSALSYTNWLTTISNEKLWPALQKPRFLLWFWLGLCLASIGFAGTSINTWEIIVWSMLALGNAYYTYESWTQHSDELTNKHNPV